MAKTESTFRNMALSLTLIALVSSALLGFVYEVTKEPIELSNLNKKLDDIQAGCAGIHNDPNWRCPGANRGRDSLEIYPRKGRCSYRICS